MGESFNDSYISPGYIFSFRQSPKESLLDICLKWNYRKIAID